MNIFWNRVHTPHLIYHPGYSSFPVSYTYHIKPIYFQYSPPASTSHHYPLHPVYPTHSTQHSYPGNNVYKTPFFKQFNHIVKAQTWES